MYFRVLLFLLLLSACAQPTKERKARALSSAGGKIEHYIDFSDSIFHRSLEQVLSARKKDTSYYVGGRLGNDTVGFSAEYLGSVASKQPWAMLDIIEIGATMGDIASTDRYTRIWIYAGKKPLGFYDNPGGNLQVAVRNDSVIFGFINRQECSLETPVSMRDSIPSLLTVWSCLYQDVIHNLHFHSNMPE